MNVEILSNLVITKVHSVLTLYTPDNVKIKREDRPCWAVAIKYEGQTVYTSGGKEFLSELNHIVILPKGCSYDWRCTRAGHCCIIEFECNATYREPISIQVKNGERLLSAFKDLEYKRNMKNPLIEPESIRDVYSILLSLIPNSAERYLDSERRQSIDKAVKYISQHYAAQITNDALAAVSGLSTVYFRKLFTAIMGTSPISYARKLRIEKAKEILRSDYSSLSDVAASLGYSSLYDFSRDFKKHVGVPPSKFE